MPPRVLKNFNSYVNGRGFQGRIDEHELPEITIKTDEHRAGGMDAPVELDMGMEAMTTKVTVSDPDSPLLKLLGVPGTRIVSRGSFVRDSDNSRVPVVVEMGGKFKKTGMGSWKSGEKAPFEHEATLDFYSLTVGGEEIYYIDVHNMVRRIGGVDQLAGIRQDIGLA